MRESKTLHHSLELTVDRLKWSATHRCGTPTTNGDGVIPLANIAEIALIRAIPFSRPDAIAVYYKDGLEQPREIFIPTLKIDEWLAAFREADISVKTYPQCSLPLKNPWTTHGLGLLVSMIAMTISLGVSLIWGANAVASMTLFALAIFAVLSTTVSGPLKRRIWKPYVLRWEVGLGGEATLSDAGIDAPFAQARRVVARIRRALGRSRRLKWWLERILQPASLVLLAMLFARGQDALVVAALLIFIYVPLAMYVRTEELKRTPNVQVASSRWFGWTIMDLLSLASLAVCFWAAADAMRNAQANPAIPLTMFCVHVVCQAFALWIRETRNDDRFRLNTE